MRSELTPNPDLIERFPDLHPPLSSQAALVEANRCLNCFDAPCTSACPTHIDVPRFIKKIASGNPYGSAVTILDANILGASCSRVCPVSVLCEGACVLHQRDEKPIEIGRLQRHAMEYFYGSGARLPARSVEPRRGKVACIGGGPASLSCASELRRSGYEVTIFEQRTIPGGLNTYGVAEYKLRSSDSLREIELVRSLGVELRLGVSIASAEDLLKLESEFDAIFVGVGLGEPHRLKIEGEDSPSVQDAVSFIEAYKTGRISSVSGQVIVVGAGNTGIDAAVAAIRLGATEATVLSRRSEAEMPAFSFEHDHARLEGVKFVWFVQPVKIECTQHAQSTLECVSTRVGEDGRVTLVDDRLHLPFSLLLVAAGQSPVLGMLRDFRGLQVAQSRIVVDPETGRTSHAKYFAGGDCVNGGREVVDAVADGKRAARGIAKMLEETPQ